VDLVLVVDDEIIVLCMDLLSHFKSHHLDVDQWVIHLQELGEIHETLDGLNDLAVLNDVVVKSCSSSHNENDFVCFDDVAEELNLVVV
jgi:hypothetical protein